MQIEMIKTDEIKPYDKNPRKNQKAVPAVAKSIQAFGFKVPIILDSNHTIIAGHTRWKAAQSLGMIQVPCIIADDLTPEQVRAFRIADNKVAEIAEWDEALLAQELNDLKDLFDWQGFDINLDEMKLSGEPEEDDFDLDAELDRATAAIAKTGDIYQLGNHRVMCGEITVEKSYVEAREPFERQIKQAAREVLKHRRKWKHET
jgi:site-specific DNA-methyltransferase (adenine-specific)